MGRGGWEGKKVIGGRDKGDSREEEGKKVIGGRKEEER